MISIVIPLYNKAHTILPTLNSVLSQTYQDFEVIIVDDGSTDNGAQVIEQHISDSRIRIFSQDNQGVSAARNKGVEFSKNEYIAFLDGDDLWQPEYLETMKKAIESFPDAGMVCSAGIVRHPDGKEYPRISEKYRNNIIEIDFFENPHVFVHTSATIVSKKIFKQVNGFPVGVKRNEDYALFFSIALNTKVVYIGYPLSVYMGGISGQATSAKIEDNIQLLNDCVQRQNIVFENWKKSKYTNRSYEIFLMYELRHYFIVYLRDNNYHVINYFLTNLNYDVVSKFSSIERLIISKQIFRKLAIFYILLTKLRWRMRGYDRIRY